MKGGKKKHPSAVLNGTYLFFSPLLCKLYFFSGLCGSLKPQDLFIYLRHLGDLFHCRAICPVYTELGSLQDDFSNRDISLLAWPSWRPSMGKARREAGSEAHVGMMSLLSFPRPLPPSRLPSSMGVQKAVSVQHSIA